MENEKNGRLAGRSTNSRLCADFSLSTLKHMRLSKQAIEDFKSIYKKECGIALSEDEAAEEALRLLQLFRLLLRPLPAQSMADRDASDNALLTYHDNQ